jgi:ABC-2 type transport system ATP-binding protein
MTLAIDIQELVVSYDHKRNVLDHISVQVTAGETYGLIGLNGEGKTTLIKTLLGLRDEQSGRIAMFGRDRRDPLVRNDLAYLPERFDPPAFLSGIGFIKFTASLYRRPVVRADLNDMAERIGLNPAVLDHRVQTYSKGMRQKLGLMATVATGCALMILDEPMSGLDPRARVQVKELIVAERAKGRTVFLSSHILADMDEICDHVAVLHGATIRYIGTPEGLRELTSASTLEKAFLSVIEQKAVA